MLNSTFKDLLEFTLRINKKIFITNIQNLIDKSVIICYYIDRVNLC